MAEDLTVLKLEGNNFQIGFQHGKALANDIKQSIKRRYEHLKKNLNLDFDDAIKESLKFLPNVEKYFPEYIKELEGISEGAQIPFERIFFIQVASELAFRPVVHCSAFAITPQFTKERKLLIGQNLDGIPLYRKYYIFHIKPDGKPDVLMFAIAGVMGYLSINQYGIAHVFNTLTYRGPGWKYGVTHYFIQRKMHEMKSVKECIDFIKELPVSSSANYLISDDYGNIVDLEVSTNGVREIRSDKMLVHTNHFLHKDFIDYKESTKGMGSSQFRYQRLSELILEKLPVTLNELMAIMGDHENYPEGVCSHQENGLGNETIASLIFSPQEGKMFIALGAPCNTAFKSYSFKTPTL